MPKQQSSSTDKFEGLLRRGRNHLDKARSEYETLEGIDSVPNKIVDAIGDLELELDELDQNLEVAEKDIILAEETVSRTSVLADVFVGLKQRQQILIEGTAKRVSLFFKGERQLSDQYDIPDKIETTVENIEHRHSMLERLISGDRYGQILSNEQVNPDSIETEIHALSDKISESTTAIDRTEVYLSVCEGLLDDIHERLAALKEENDERVTHSSELQQLKQQQETAESQLSESPDEAVSTANEVLVNCLSLHHDIVAAHADQELAIKLATVCKNKELAVDHDIDDNVAKGDPESLLSVIADAIASEVDLSTSGRLLQLLQEHDGSVVRTREATDFDFTTILDHLTQLYEEEEIADINVEFTK